MKISIITVTYNRAHVIEGCLASLIEQSYSNIEHILIDGSSTDETLRVLQKHAKQIAVLVSEPDKGIYDALNKGIAHSTGEIVGFLHSDDIYSRIDALQNVVNVFTDNPNVDMVIGNAVFVDSHESGFVLRKCLSKRFRPWMLRFGFMPPHTATFLRRSVFETFGVHRIDYRSAGDFEFFVRTLWQKQVSFHILDQIIISMLVGGKSTSGLVSYWRTSNEILKALKDHCIRSNWAFVLIRLPIKYLSQSVFRFLK
ncbi:glycosyltransferase [Litorivicinus sp.]|nr:glycosyltransferase [Litorivicinus sp.]MDC1240004.1 glycosyltransferase [Litorivicinus sp.]